MIFPTPHSDPFYTNVQGKWQRLSNRNLLITEPSAGRVVEVTHRGETVWEWVVTPHGESETPEVTEGTRVQLTESQIDSWECSLGRSTDDQPETPP